MQISGSRRALRELNDALTSEIGLLRAQLHTTRSDLGAVQALLVSANGTVRSQAAALSSSEAQLAALRVSPSQPAASSGSGQPRGAGESSSVPAALPGPSHRQGCRMPACCLQGGVSTPACITCMAVTSSQAALTLTMHACQWQMACFKTGMCV